MVLMYKNKVLNKHSWGAEIVVHSMKSKTIFFWKPDRGKRDLTSADDENDDDVVGVKHHDVLEEWSHSYDP